MPPSLIIDQQALLPIILIKGDLAGFLICGTPCLLAKDAWQSLEDGGQDARSHATVHQVELLELSLAFKPVDDCVGRDLLNVKPTDLQAYQVPLHGGLGGRPAEYLLHDSVRIRLYVAIFIDQPKRELLDGAHFRCFGELGVDEGGEVGECAGCLAHGLRVKLELPAAVLLFH